MWTISKNGEPPLPLFHNNFSRFRNLKIDVFLQLLRVCEWGGLAKSLSKISLKSSSKQTDYEKFSSLWTKIWYCGGDVLHGRIFEFSIRSEIRRGRIRKCEDWSQEGQFCEGRPPLPMPNGTNQSLTLFWMEVCINETLHLEFWMN